MCGLPPKECEQMTVPASHRAIACAGLKERGGGVGVGGGAETMVMLSSGCPMPLISARVIGYRPRLTFNRILSLVDVQSAMVRDGRSIGYCRWLMFNRLLSLMDVQSAIVLD